MHMNLKELIKVLKEEHKPGYVYRGQNQKWHSPLVPSIYRSLLKKDEYFDYNKKARLNEVGVSFYEQDPDLYMASDPSKYKRVQLTSYINQVFGFPLGNLLSQQFDINSESLDVTSDPEVAAWFATYDFNQGDFIEENGSSGVIYRFTVPIESISMSTLKTMNLYNKPSYLSFDQILQEFRKCKSWKESLNSFLLYKIEAFSVLSKRCSNTRSRPLDMLSFPIQFIHESRIFRQKSGLIFPDMILSSFYKIMLIPPPKGKAEKEGFPAVEDISKRPGTDIFFFPHSPDNANNISITKEQLFPRNDPFLALLQQFLDPRGGVGWAFFHTEIGPLSVPDNPFKVIK